MHTKNPYLVFCENRDMKMTDTLRRTSILIGTTALLALFLLTTIPPAMAVSKQPYSATVQYTTIGAPAKVWFADGIMQAEDMHWSGTYVGTLGTGTMDVWFQHLTMNTATGSGTFIATWTVTVPDGTMSGNANGNITGGLTGSSDGYFRGTHGTGAFVSVEKTGTFTVDLSTGYETEEGVIIYH